MQNSKILEMLNKGQIEELKTVIQDAIYTDSLKGNTTAKRRYTNMKRYLKTISDSRPILTKPCEVKFENEIYNAFTNTYSLALTKEICGELAPHERYFSVGYGVWRVLNTHNYRDHLGIAIRFYPKHDFENSIRLKCLKTQDDKHVMDCLIADISSSKSTNMSWFYPSSINGIKKVIFNDPATIVMWNDGSKTIVKADGEPFDPEKGLAMAISKKFFGNEGNYYDKFKKWLPKEENVIKEVKADGKSRTKKSGKTK